MVPAVSSSRSLLTGVIVEYACIRPHTAHDDDWDSDMRHARMARSASQSVNDVDERALQERRQEVSRLLPKHMLKFADNPIRDKYMDRLASKLAKVHPQRQSADATNVPLAPGARALLVRGHVRECCHAPLLLTPPTTSSRTWRRVACCALF